MDLSGPIHSDGSRNSIAQWMGPGVVVYLVLHAFITNQGIALVIALPLAFYVAFTWHSAYYLYEEALVVRYFWPRQLVLPLAEIALIGQAKVFPAGDGLLVSRTGKAPVFIRPRDPSQLRDLVNEQIARRQQPAVRQVQDDEPRRHRPTRRRRTRR